MIRPIFFVVVNRLGSMRNGKFLESFSDRIYFNVTNVSFGSRFSNYLEFEIKVSVCYLRAC